ncbi:Nicotinate-nucleotide adenylyltransferase [hydrothermal vent metagenome]|uniref:Nicotinate-nucleotide adenylyltransferase n=1 Tax=hydrothermal vent metagenome TaxID=652676 RepID=A0A3B1CVD5_9ZZZZ
MKNNAKERVGIFGGSFDPVHRGHIGLATGARGKFQLDSVLFIPAYLSPHKQDSAPAPAHHRLAMLEIALAPHPAFSASEVELLKKGVSFTVDTLAHLTTLHPDTDFFLIMGIDAFMGLKTWKSVHRLLEMCHVIVATRPGYPRDGAEDCLKNLFPAQEGAYSPATLEGDVTVFHHPEKNTTINFFDLPPADIASRDIRDRTRRHLEIKNMLPPEVENYMITNQLYLEQSHL